MSSLRGSVRPLVDEYDVAMLDLDGVVYIGRDAVPAAPRTLPIARDRGMQLAFVTNNAARPPSAVAEHLTELGIPASPAEVITSAQAAARYLAEHLPPRAEVLVLGTTGLYEALQEHDLRTTDTAGPDVAAVVQGYSPSMDWRLLAEGAVAVRAGALWVATNVDPTVPSARGPLPGNGAMVAALRTATRQEPVITGKPDPTMHRETVIRTGARRPLVVGDRLDTDIEGANAVGCGSLLVFTGVTDVPDLLAAAAVHRPTYLGLDTGALLEPHPELRRAGDGVACGGWQATVGSDGVVLATLEDAGRAPGPGTGDEQTGTVAGPAGSSGGGCDTHGVTAATLDAVRVLCAAIWSHADDSRGDVDIHPGDPAAESALAELGVAP